MSGGSPIDYMIGLLEHELAGDEQASGAAWLARRHRLLRLALGCRKRARELNDSLAWCPECRGKGTAGVMFVDGPGMHYGGPLRCTTCRGVGMVDEATGRRLRELAKRGAEGV